MSEQRLKRNVGIISNTVIQIMKNFFGNYPFHEQEFINNDPQKSILENYIAYIKLFKFSDYENVVSDLQNVNKELFKVNKDISVNGIYLVGIYKGPTSNEIDYDHNDDDDHNSTRPKKYKLDLIDNLV